MKTLIIGAAIVDVMMKIEQLPKSGDDILCTASKAVIGGCAYNVARTMQNMNSPIDLCVPIGTGIHADFIRKELISYGFDLIIEDHSEDNGYCICFVEKNGERTFITVRGAESRFRKDWLKTINRSAYDWVYVAGYQVCGESGEVISEWITDWYKNADKAPTIFFAPGPVITIIEEETMSKFFALHPILHLNEKEAVEYTGAADTFSAIKILYNATHNLVIVTNGSRGAMLYDGIEMKVIPSEKVEVIDTVGAGDSHIGAIIAGIVEGLNPVDAVKRANHIAAAIVETKGPVMDRKTFAQKVQFNTTKD